MCFYTNLVQWHPILAQEGLYNTSLPTTLESGTILLWNYSGFVQGVNSSGHELFHLYFPALHGNIYDVAVDIYTASSFFRSGANWQQ
jgi:hypothetical protein